MWGLDGNGLRVLTDDEVKAFEISGAALRFDGKLFTFLDLFKFAWPIQKWKENPKTKEKEPIPHSLKSLSVFAKQGALKFGPFVLTPDELRNEEVTNQDFVILSLGKKKREMIFFKE